MEVCLQIWTYNLFLVEVSAAIGGGEGGGTGLTVPRHIAILCGAADGERVDTVGVSVTVAAVPLSSSVTRCPHEDRAQATSTLKQMHKPDQSLLPKYFSLPFKGLGFGHF